MFLHSDNVDKIASLGYVRDSRKQVISTYVDDTYQIEQRVNGVMFSRMGGWDTAEDAQSALDLIADKITREGMTLLVVHVISARQRVEFSETVVIDC